LKNTFRIADIVKGKGGRGCLFILFWR